MQHALANPLLSLSRLEVYLHCSSQPMGMVAGECVLLTRMVSPMAIPNKPDAKRASKQAISSKPLSRRANIVVSIPGVLQRVRPDHSISRPNTELSRELGTSIVVPSIALMGTVTRREQLLCFLNRK